MKHTNLRQRRIERGLTLQEMASATHLPAWALVTAEREARRDTWVTHVRAMMAAVLLRAGVAPAT